MEGRHAKPGASAFRNTGLACGIKVSAPSQELQAECQFDWQMACTSTRETKGARVEPSHVRFDAAVLLQLATWQMLGSIARKA